VLFGAVLFGAVLFGAVLFGAVLFGAVLFGAVLFGTIAPGMTVLGTTPLNVTVAEGKTMRRAVIPSSRSSGVTAPSFPLGAEGSHDSLGAICPGFVPEAFSPVSATALRTAAGALVDVTGLTVTGGNWDRVLVPLRFVTFHMMTHPGARERPNSTRVLFT
jgi:hypothetical protein